ncbi:MAG TPA: polymorphic toxin-type HINT domain-containing protein [Kofleriaceae bacterium]|nr:polymorphic toxin-type HINT domain-containing protein [Kofleriaceae bacterium]
MISWLPLLRDRRGHSTVQTLIIVVGIALAGIAGVKALSTAATDRTNCAGEEVQAMGAAAVPCSEGGESGSPKSVPEPPKAPEPAPKPEPEPDPADELIAIVADIIGFTDAKKCITEGDIVACLFTLSNFSPFKAIGVAIKLAKNAGRIIKAVDRLLAARKAKKAKEAADEAAGKCKGGKCDKPGVCFAPGTPVLSADGMVAIEELEAGDLVWSRDEHTGEEGYRPVVRTFVTPDQPLLSVMLEDGHGGGETLEVTAEHPFQVDGRGWVAAMDLRPDDQVVSAGGGRLRVSGSSATSRRTTVYNFEVEEFHTYFVGEGAAWVHNECKTPEEIAAAKKELADIDNKLKEKGLSAKEKQRLRARKKELKDELGDSADEAPAVSEKAVQEKLGDLADVRDMRADQAIRSRGGNASNVREALGDRFKDSTVGEIAELAAQGDAGAEKALKIIKQAAKKGQEH